ncbi:putative 2-aminoethylphosphonate ABC transporter ATP-binding protein [Orrella marina]|uniref:Putative 2-aminoethylphosphonate ABC transporter ATP-binding protein n=1 Tax=Orrella marina TaxID=2163011 RepID=A0A2R4XPZ9_9BURK|nr:putative 2-aminoethylphosphonate ABC transporter ATP-binding protein [Orrella marina]AWB35845.1 putative 2-aminoethylphosphonate ABC transporter ATP-binding protein [Orrella marina]
MHNPFLSIKGINKQFGDVVALDNVSLDVAQGELVCLVGPSGCGKTTLLRVIAGLEKQDSGTLNLDGRDISHLDPQQRDYGILFQSYALFPNLTVSQNIAFGLSQRRTDRSKVTARVREMLEMVGLPGMEGRYPGQLSGGQQQRVAMARALAPAPSLLLLDEPMSALDAKVREHLQSELRQLQKKLSVTTVMVTHDQHEAMAMADRIAVMQSGAIRQIGNAQQLYRSPGNDFVAGFVGDANWLPYERVDASRVRVGNNILSLGGAVPPATSGRLCIRPESIQIIAPSRDIAPNTLNVRISETVFLGTHFRVTLKLACLPEQCLRAWVPANDASLADHLNGSQECSVHLPANSLIAYG